MCRYIYIAAALGLGGCTASGPLRVETAAVSNIAGDNSPKHYVCYRTARPVVIDGHLDDAAWKAAPWTDDFEDIEGAAKPRPLYRTRAKMLWDDQYLYIGADLEEEHVWANLTEHDQIVFNDPDFEIFIDPNGDRREYYEIEINARNTIFDLFLVRTYIDGGPALHAWDCKGLRSAVYVDGTLNDARDTDHGWSVEFALPWATLKEAAGRPCPPADGDTWRMNFSRVEWQIRVIHAPSTAGGSEQTTYEKLPNTPEHNWVWSPQGVVNMHRPERWGYVEFSPRSAAAD
jgi:hypothetical protein